MTKSTPKKAVAKKAATKKAAAKKPAKKTPAKKAAAKKAPVKKAPAKKVSAADKIRASVEQEIVKIGFDVEFVEDFAESKIEELSLLADDAVDKGLLFLQDEVKKQKKNILKKIVAWLKK